MDMARKDKGHINHSQKSTNKKIKIVCFQKIEEYFKQHTKSLILPKNLN